MKPLKKFKFKHVALNIKLTIKAYDLQQAYNRMLTLGVHLNHFKLKK